MDVQKVESVAIPTLVAGAVGGTAGYLTKKAFDKDGKMTTTLQNEMVDSFTKTRNGLIKEADSLDAIVIEDLSDIKGIITKGLEKDNPMFAKYYAEAKTPEEMGRVLRDAESCGIDTSKYIKEAVDNNISNQKKLYNFVKKNFSVLGLEQAEGQSKKEAINEYLSGKDTVQKVKAAFNKAIQREELEAYKPDSYIKELFDDVYDVKAKKFKTDEASKEIVDGFKSFARRMKLKEAGKFAACASGIALLSSFIATKINDRY